MKRIVLLLVSVLFLSALTQPAAAQKIGDVVGQVLYTDITAKIDGHPIRAFNVANHMCVVAEDLRAYGFDVIWHADERVLTVDPSKSFDPASFPAAVPEPPKGKIGTPAFPVLYTDIVTYVNSRLVESFNIDGETVIFFQDLGRSGVVRYDNSVRTTSYTHGVPWSASLSRTDFPRNTGVGTLSAVVRPEGGKPVLTLASDPGGQFELHVSERGIRLAHYTYSIPEGDPYYDTDFYRAFHALATMGLPDVDANYLHYDNTDTQREAVSAYLRVTLNGEPVKGDCFLSWGNGHVDINFTFDSFVPLNVGDVLLIEIGAEGALGAGTPATPAEELRALRERFLFHETETVENDLCYVIRGYFSGTTSGNTNDLQVVYKAGGTKNLTGSVYPYFHMIDRIEFGADPKILIVTGRVLSKDGEKLTPSTLEVDVYTGAAAVRDS